MKNKFLIIAIIVLLIPITIFYVIPSFGVSWWSPYDPREQMFSNSVLDTKTTENPNECWVEMDGVLTKCQMSDEFPPGFEPIPHPTMQDVFCTNDCKENDTALISGQKGLEICKVLGRACAPIYPGMINQNGSITVGNIISTPQKTEMYQFLIQGETISYVKTENEN